MPNTTLVSSTTHDLYIKILMYVLCMTGMIMLVVFAAPELYAVMMLSTASAIFGWTLIVILGVSLSWILIHLLLGIPERPLAPPWPVDASPAITGRSMAHITSRLQPNAHTSPDRLVMPPLDATPAQENKALAIPSSPITELTAQGHRSFDFNNFRHQMCLLDSFPNDLLLPAYPLHDHLIEKDKTAVTYWLATVVRLKEEKQKLEVQAISPLQQVETEADSKTETQGPNEEEHRLFRKIAQRWNWNTEDSFAVDHVDYIELYNGEFIPEKAIKKCSLVLPLPESKATGAGDQYLIVHPPATLQWCLLSKGQTQPLHQWEIKSKEMIALVYLKDGMIASIEISADGTASLQIWPLSKQKQRDPVMITHLDQSEYSDMGLKALGDGSFLSHGKKHGVKLWRRSKLKALQFQSKVLFTLPDSTGLCVDFRIKLLKFGYLAYFYQARKAECFIMDIHAPWKPHIRLELPAHISISAVEGWGKYLLTSYSQIQAPFTSNFSFYNLQKLMQQREDQQVKTPLLQWLHADPSGLVLEYCNSDFDAPPKETTQRDVLGSIKSWCKKEGFI